MSRFIRRSCVATALLVMVFLTSGALAQIGGGPTVIRETDEVALDSKGDATLSGTLIFPSEGSYSEVKSNYPDPNLLLRSLLGASGKDAITDATVKYDDDKKAIVLNETVLGSAVVRRNHWQAFVGGEAEHPELIYTDNQKCILMKVKASGNLLLIDRINLQLPAPCTYLKLDDAGWLNYDFDRPAKAGTVDLDAELKVKPHIISAVYKAYGNEEFNDGMFWTSKTIFTNSGTGDIADLKISYRIGDYSPWSSESGHTYKLVAAGGHVVDLYYPIFDPKVAALNSPTPVDFEVKYDYSDASGKQYEDSTSQRIEILGANQIEYSNIAKEEQSPLDTIAGWKDVMSNSMLTAAWVNYMDPPVRALSGLVHQSAGDAVSQAGQTDEATEAFCKALFLVEQENGLQYQNSTQWFMPNVQLGQSLKFPRDTLRDKSGTCIELAILYAAACESSGVKAYLMMVPGHCFPMVELPESHELFPVESTAVNNYYEVVVNNVDQHRKERMTFEDACNGGRRNLIKYTQEGMFYRVDVENMQGFGVQSPDLPALDNDVITKWGWKSVDLKSGGSRNQGQPGA